MVRRPMQPGARPPFRPSETGEEVPFGTQALAATRRGERFRALATKKGLGPILSQPNLLKKVLG